jgi:hypothetical protein
MNRVYRQFAVKVFLSAFLSLVGLKAHAQTYTFETASYSAPGVNSVSPPQGNQTIATADFNNDGIPDVAVLGSSSGGPVLSIFLHRADGTFAQSNDYPVQAAGFTVGDFNGDGKLDVFVVTFGSSPSETLFLGNGDGTLQPPVPLNQDVGNLYTAAASADFNGDGKLDLLLLTQDFGTGAAMAILLGNGDGTFQPAVTYSVPVAPYLALGDFNADGKPDIAIAGTSDVSSGTSQLSILINNGDGTFKAPANHTISGLAQAIATADLNADGNLDLVVPTGGFSAAISVLRGNGDGTFASPTVYTSNLLSIFSTSIAVADFNGDGKLDLALTNSEGPANAAAIVLGNGDGTFQSPPLLYSTGLLPAAVVALDVNADGKPDLAVLGGYGVLSYFSLTTLINRGDGTFPNRVTYPVLQSPYSLVLGDFNHDGKMDIATTSFTPAGGVSVLLGNADGTFQIHLDSPTGQFPSALSAGDFNGDGKLDLVVANSTSTSELLSTLLNNGDGTFQNSISQIVPGGVRSLAVGDFNGDGKLDVAAVIDTPTARNTLSIFFGRGDGSFAAPVQYPDGSTLTSPPFQNGLDGDLNGDHKLDLAVATDNGIAILLGNGDGTFQPFRLIPSLLSFDPGDELLALADFNGDGKLDIVRSTQTGTINVALGNGDGTFRQAQGFQIPSILNTQSAVVGDFNGDGNLDLAFASQSSDVMTILFGNGDGTFTRHTEYSVGSVSNNVNFMAAADFNADGALDIALVDFDSGQVSVFINRAVAAFAPRELKFANQGIGTISPAQTVTLTNVGAAQLAITSIAGSGDFPESADCGSNLDIGNSCSVNVTFAPAAAGLRTGMLSFTDSASVVPQVLALSGTGIAQGFLMSIGSGASASQTVTAGQTASYSLILTPDAGFNATVTLACSGAPMGATCTATPVSVVLTGTSAVTETISVATTAAAFPPPIPKSIPALPVYLPVHVNLLPWLTLLATLVMVALLGIRPEGVRRPAWLALTATTILVFICTGCGSGGSGSTPPPRPLATPAGTYTITVSATSGAITRNLRLTLTVQ